LFISINPTITNTRDILIIEAIIKHPIIVFGKSLDGFFAYSTKQAAVSNPIKAKKAVLLHPIILSNPF